MTDNKTGEPITRKKLTDEVKFICYLGVLLVGIVSSYFMQTQKIALIERDISYIKTNHLTHIEANITDLQGDVSDIDKNLAVIATILEGLEFSNL